MTTPEIVTKVHDMVIIPPPKKAKSDSKTGKFIASVFWMLTRDVRNELLIVL